jgi:hypothetical protein
MMSTNFIDMVDIMPYNCYMILLIISYIAIKLTVDCIEYKPIRIGKTHIIRPEDMATSVLKE